MKNIKDDRQEEKRKKEERRIKRKALNSLYLNTSFDRRKRGKETAAVCVNRVKARRHMHPLTH